MLAGGQLDLLQVVAVAGWHSCWAFAGFMIPASTMAYFGSAGPLRRCTLLPGMLPAADHRSKVNYDLNKVLEGGLEESIQSMLMLDQRLQLQVS